MPCTLELFQIEPAHTCISGLRALASITVAPMHASHSSHAQEVEHPSMKVSQINVLAIKCIDLSILAVQEVHESLVSHAQGILAHFECGFRDLLGIPLPIVNEPTKLEVLVDKGLPQPELAIVSPPLLVPIFQVMPIFLLPPL